MRSRAGVDEDNPSAERFWRGHILIGFALMGGEALAAICYLLVSRGPHRSLLLGIAAGAAAMAAPGSLLAGRVARRSWRESFSLTWTATCVVALSACASLDGGVESPFLSLVLLPIMYAALILRPRPVAVCGTVSLAGLFVVGLTDHDITIPQESLLMLSAIVTGAFILALLSSAYRCRLEASRASLAAQLRQMAATDHLTGCWNQGAFHERLRSEMDRAVRYKRPLSLLVCDVDLFKSFNDAYGHERGDAALQAIASRLRTAARSSDVVGRVGGDEFAILMPEAASSEAAELAARIVAAQADNEPGDPPTVSIGTAALAPDKDTVAALFSAADAAMYQAKATGRGRAVEAGDPLLGAIDSSQPEDGQRAEEVARSERRQRLETELIFTIMLEEAPIGFAFIDPDFRILRTNPALMAMSHSPLVNHVGRRACDVIPHFWAQLEPHFEQLLHDGLPVRNLELVDPNDEGDAPTATLTNLYPVRLGGRTIGIGVVVVDIADRKRLESAQERLTDAVVHALAAAVEARDPYTAGHQLRVANMSGAIACALGYDAWTVKGIALAASIHDLGKIAIPAEILAKPMGLNDAEFQLVRGHSQAGYDMLAGLEFPWPVADMIVQHHERLDGSGYPNGLHGDQICAGARIIAVADVVEAMAAHRPYRSALGMEAALRAVDAARGSLFDPDVVDACISIIRAGETSWDSPRQATRS